MERGKIYCAGPLFNPKEREEMEEIANILTSEKFSVFLPQKDGFEFAKLSVIFKKNGINEQDANIILNKAIFMLDVFHVLDSDGLILNANGRVPDEGAMVEAGIAWNAGKEVHIYKNDSRTLLCGSENPLMLGLSGFKLIYKIEDIPSAFSGLVRKVGMPIDNRHVLALYENGRKIASLMTHKGEEEDGKLIEALMDFCGAK